MIKNICLFFIALLVLYGCATDTQYTVNTRPYTVYGTTYYPMATADNFSETGTASWYGPKFHGKKTSSGETYDQYAYTAAHKTLPFGTRLRVTNLDNGRTTKVVVNDRGPFKSGRIIDLSRAAAQDIDMIGTGTARVRIEAIGTSGTQKIVTTQAKATASTTQTTVAIKNNAAISNGKYYVQVGAFSSVDNANNLGKKVVDSGYKYRVTNGVNSNYLVQVGPYSTKSEATTMRDKLRATYSGAFVVE